MKLTFVVIYFFVSVFFSYGQDSARLNIEAGSSVNFYFNSFHKYQNGIAYPNFTRLSVYYNDTTSAANYPTWKLDVKALTDSIEGGGLISLPLETIELEASGVNSSGTQILQNTVVDLITGGQITHPNSELIYISYYCGQNITGLGSKLLGKSADYYVVDIIFTLSNE